jgi:hypothetical protein
MSTGPPTITSQRTQSARGLTHSSLLSIGKLCDAGCNATFTHATVVITHHDATIMHGSRDPCTGLWRLPLSHTPPNTTTPTVTPEYQCRSVYQTTTLPTLVKYLHAAAFSPTASTWIPAIKRGFFQSWPGLTPELARKYFPQLEATTKGHMD